MSSHIKENKMEKQYLNAVIVSLKQSQNKNKTAWLERYTPDFVEILFGKIKRLCYFTTELNNHWIAEILTLLISDIHYFCQNGKMKDKALNNHLENLEKVISCYDDILKSYPLDNQRLLREVDPSLTEVLYNSQHLYRNSAFARFQLNQYTNLLMSKIVDYLPKDVESRPALLDPFIELLDGYKAYLTFFIEHKHHEMTYPFTMTFNHIPITLKALNQFNKLGDNIVDWVDKFKTSQVSDYLNDKGYDVFAGWDNLSKGVVKESLNQTQPSEGHKSQAEVTPELEKRTINYIKSLIPMFISNPKFTLHDKDHYITFCRVLALPFYATSCKALIKPSHVKKWLLEVKRYYRSSSMRVFKRNDRTYWFSDRMIDYVNTILDSYRTDRVTYLVIDALTHIYDFITLSRDRTDYKESVQHLHRILARSHNFIFYNRTKPSPEDIGLLVTYFNQYRKGFEKLLDVKDHVFIDSGFNFWLNALDEPYYKALMTEFKKWVGMRNTKEYNQSEYEYMYQYTYLMSYQCKAMFLKDLEGIEVNNYGGLKTMVETLRDIAKNDIENPYKEFREAELEKDDVMGINITGQGETKWKILLHSNC